MKKKDPVAEELSRRMRALSLRNTPEGRSEAAKKAWRTKKLRIAVELGAAK